MRVSFVTYQSGSGLSAPLSAERPSFVLVFGGTSIEEDASFWEQLSSAFPGVPVAGCSTAGEIFGTPVTDDGAVIGIVEPEHATARMETCHVAQTGESYEAGATLARALTGPDLRGVLVFSDGSIVNGSALVRGLNEHLPSGTVVTGGL